MLSLRSSVIALAATLAITTACTNKKVDNPLAKVDSKQPDKVLFDRGMDAMKHNRFDVARLDMQTLINTYPDSEFIARAKLALADSWYAEGGTAALAQAETEYKDFETFFPNMPEAAEAQVKIANIHFQQMEKPDRDFTHAMRAEQEYRQVILQYPDNQQMISDFSTKAGEAYAKVLTRYPVMDRTDDAKARLLALHQPVPRPTKADLARNKTEEASRGEQTMLSRAMGMVGRHPDVSPAARV